MLKPKTVVPFVGTNSNCSTIGKFVTTNIDPKRSEERRKRKALFSDPRSFKKLFKHWPAIY